MSAPRQARFIIPFDLLALILILGVTFKSESRPPDERTPIVTLLQCETLPSHESPPFDKQGSYERHRGTFRTSINERQLFLVCTDRVYRQPKLRVDRSRDDRGETRIPAPE
ncbi:MAG TPA: hypothetical protein VGC73_02570 [Pyrinomonadaceae bacterium]